MNLNLIENQIYHILFNMTITPINQSSWITKDWSELPEEITHIVLSKLKPYEGAGVSPVCKKWHHAHVSYIRHHLCKALDQTIKKLLTFTRNRLLSDGFETYGHVTAESIARNILNIIDEPSAEVQTLISRCEGVLSRLPQIVCEQFALHISQKNEIEKALTLDENSYSYQKRSAREVKELMTDIKACVTEYKHRYDNLQPTIPVTLLERITRQFESLACTLPNFNELRGAASIGAVRTEFFNAAKKLVCIGTSNFHYERGTFPNIFTENLIKQIVVTGQEFSLVDLLSVYKLDFPCGIESLNGTKTPHLLAFKMEQAGWVGAYRHLTKAKDRIRELVHQEEFSTSSVVELFERYKLTSGFSHSFDVLLRALIEAKRYPEIFALFDTYPQIRGSANSIIHEIIEAMIADNETELAYKTLPIMHYSSDDVPSIIQANSALLSHLIRNNHKSMALKLCQEIWYIFKKVTSSLHYTDKLTLFHWKIEAAQGTSLKDFEYRDIKFYKNLYKTLMKEALYDQALLVLDHIPQTEENRNHCLWSLATTLASTGNLPRARAIASQMTYNDSFSLFRPIYRLLNTLSLLYHAYI